MRREKGELVLLPSVTTCFEGMQLDDGLDGNKRKALFSVLNTMKHRNYSDTKLEDQLRDDWQK